MNNLDAKTNEFSDDGLRPFKLFRIIIAAACISIPLILWPADDLFPGFPSGISEYVQISKSYVFGMLLCMATLLFLFNGIVFLRQKKRGLSPNKQGKWSNVVLGFALLLVIILHCTA